MRRQQRLTGEARFALLAGDLNGLEPERVWAKRVRSGHLDLTFWLLPGARAAELGARTTR